MARISATKEGASPVCRGRTYSAAENLHRSMAALCVLCDEMCVLSDDPNYELELNKVHQQYYQSLADLFHRYKDHHPFYTDATVVLQ